MTVARAGSALSGTVVDTQGAALEDGRRIWVPAEKLSPIEASHTGAFPERIRSPSPVPEPESNRWILLLAGVLGAAGTTSLMFAGMGYDLSSRHTPPPDSERVTAAPVEPEEERFDGGDRGPAIISPNKGVTAEELLALEAEVERLERLLDHEIASIRQERFEENVDEVHQHREEQTEHLRLIKNINTTRAQRLKIEHEEERRKIQEAQATAWQERSQISCRNVTVNGAHGFSQIRQECVDLGPPKAIPSGRFGGQR